MTLADLTLVVCAAPLASRTPELVAACLAEDWRPTVVATPAAEAWLDADAVTSLAGEPPRVAYRSPSEPKRGGEPAAMVICPATFNTINKAAAGIADTYALGIICEAMGTGVPLLVAPMVSNKLWGHPAWSSNLAVFRGLGADLIDIRNGELLSGPVQSGTGPEIVAGFDPTWITRRIKAMLTS
jgi:phosphopantothenoylcysteine synthetase/decarboxylase